MYSLRVQERLAQSASRPTSKTLMRLSVLAIALGGMIACGFTYQYYGFPRPLGLSAPLTKKQCDPPGGFPSHQTPGLCRFTMLIDSYFLTEASASNVMNWYRPGIGLQYKFYFLSISIGPSAVASRNQTRFTLSLDFYLAWPVP
jgi:hypothetical protein